MGILNITPDSFYASSRVNEASELLDKAKQMIDEGADILDIGGQSSRPGATPVSQEEELQRVVQAIRSLRSKFPDTLLSVDTYRAAVAKAAVSAGADIINDISAGDLDPDMFEVVRECQVPYILMHMQGIPESMQENPNYGDVTSEVVLYLSKKLRTIRLMGIADAIIDPGFGFGKTLQHNYELMNQLDHLEVLEAPVLVGVSRKSMIHKLLDIDSSEALNGTTVLHTLALQKGAAILRVHDVKEAVEAVKIVTFANTPK